MTSPSASVSSLYIFVTETNERAGLWSLGACALLSAAGSARPGALLRMCDLRLHALASLRKKSAAEHAPFRECHKEDRVPERPQSTGAIRAAVRSFALRTRRISQQRPVRPRVRLVVLHPSAAFHSIDPSLRANRD